MAFVKGVSGNAAGRPPKDPAKIKTNRERREDTLLELVRKFRPLQTKAIQAVVGILDNKEASDQNKIKAASIVIMTYKDLVKDLYNKDYDSEEAEAIQENNTPAYSLHVLDFNKDKTGTGN